MGKINWSNIKWNRMDVYDFEYNLKIEIEKEII